MFSRRWLPKSASTKRDAFHNRYAPRGGWAKRRATERMAREEEEEEEEEEEKEEEEV